VYYGTVLQSFWDWFGISRYRFWAVLKALLTGGGISVGEQQHQEHLYHQQVYGCVLVKSAPFRGTWGMGIFVKFGMPGAHAGECILVKFGFCSWIQGTFRKFGKGVVHCGQIWNLLGANAAHL